MASLPTQHPSIHFRPSPQTSSKMSITQTFYLAHKARGKLSSEASRSHHNLRLLVGHANLLDSLMIRLAEAEQEQDLWYNNTVRGNEAKDYPEALEEEDEQCGSLATDYDSDTSDEDEDNNMDIDYFHPMNENTLVSRRGVATIDVSELVDSYENPEEDEEDVDEDGLFSLRRTTSHRPPSLCSDLSDDEDEESNPPSPPQPALDHHPKYTMGEKIAVSTTSYYNSHHISPSPISDEQLFFITPSDPPATLISSF